MGYKYPKFQFEYENEHLKNVIQRQKKIIAFSIIFAILALLIIFIAIVKSENEIKDLRLIEMQQPPVILVQPQTSVKLKEHQTPIQVKPDFEQSSLKLEERQTEVQTTHDFDEVYKKPKECVKPSSDKKFVECINHYIRSKRQYESINQ